MGPWYIKLNWWRWVESNYRSIGYEPIALTAEPHRHKYPNSISKKKLYVKTFLENFRQLGIFFATKAISRPNMNQKTLYDGCRLIEKCEGNTRIDVLITIVKWCYIKKSQRMLTLFD